MLRDIFHIIDNPMESLDYLKSPLAVQRSWLIQVGQHLKLNRLWLYLKTLQKLPLSFCNLVSV